MSTIWGPVVTYVRKRGEKSDAAAAAPPRSHRGRHGVDAMSPRNRCRAAAATMEAPWLPHSRREAAMVVFCWFVLPSWLPQSRRGCRRADMERFFVDLCWFVLSFIDLNYLLLICIGFVVFFIDYHCVYFMCLWFYLIFIVCWLLFRWFPFNYIDFHCWFPWCSLLFH